MADTCLVRTTLSITRERAGTGVPRVHARAAGGRVHLATCALGGDAEDVGGAALVQVE